jgi:hypothetical protein
MSHEPPFGAARCRSGLGSPRCFGARSRPGPFCRKLPGAVRRLPSESDPEVSHQLERLAARAWPADEVEEVEGWLLRRTVGVDRRRSNSLLPPADPSAATRTVDLALATAEELDFSTTIQVSPAEGHLRLDAELTIADATPPRRASGTPRARRAQAIPPQPRRTQRRAARPPTHQPPSRSAHGARAATGRALRFRGCRPSR